MRYGREADSTIAHRSHREPCLEMWPLRVWSALERSVGVSSERRKIERNLHDGAQQQLVALGVQLRLLERLAAGVPEADTLAAGLQRLRDMLGGALDDLRDLARGIYPPLLADRGLVAALDAQARKAAVTTVVESRGVEQ